MCCHWYLNSWIDTKHVLKAIELSRNGSTVLTFTDASAKDENRSEEVIMTAQERNITMTTILTGSCSRRKRRSVSRKFAWLIDWWRAVIFSKHDVLICELFIKGALATILTKKLYALEIGK